MSVNTKMTAIADKIRSLLGTSGEMGLDEMALNLSTALSHVDSCCTALSDKGVNISSATLGEIPGLIGAIETDGGSSVESCEVTFDLSAQMLFSYSYIGVSSAGDTGALISLSPSFSDPANMHLSGVLRNSFIVLALNTNTFVTVSGSGSYGASYSTAFGSIQIVRISGNCTISDPA